MYQRTRVFLAAGIGILIFGITLICLGSIAPALTRRFNMDAVAAGTSFSILPLGILAGSFLFGPFCDRFGYKYLLVLACVIMFVGFEGIALTASPAMLKAFIFAFGLGGGIINGASNAVVADISSTHKGANLSLLGVFFGIGALGMPLLLAALAHRFNSFQVIAAVGWLTLAAGIWYLFIRFPAAKQAHGIAFGNWKQLLTPLLFLVSLFLFCQSSLEAIVNNWATTFLLSRGAMSESGSLYALSMHIAGMTGMRLLSGTVFKQVRPARMMATCMCFLFIGFAFLQFGNTAGLALAGLVLTGAGLAEGFPVMLGYVGERFARLSATAFSFVFVVALIGNIALNYVMGWIVQEWGVRQLTIVCFCETAVMTALLFFIGKQTGSDKHSN